MADTSKQLATLINGLGLTAEQIAALSANLDTLNANALAELNARVAATEEGLMVTRRGFELLGKALAGKELCYTRAAYGDSSPNGTLVEPTEDEKFELNNLLNFKQSLPILSVKFTGGGTAGITFAVHNDDLAEGYFIRETGLFAEDPDTGEEVLYCYRNNGLKGKWIPAGGGVDIWRVRVNVTTAVGNATNITAVIDAGQIYVTQEEFAEHIASPLPHPDIPLRMNEILQADKLWATGADNNLHPISITNITNQILGGDAAQLPLMNSRISQTEVNIANLFTQLNAENDLGVKPNLLITDDFANPTNIDFYRQPVITSVAGISNVRVASLEGLNAGSWYTISDGAQNEFVQVTALAQNGGASVAILNTTIQNTYNLPDTKLYRTTLNVEGGVGQGAGDVRSATYPYTFEWRGTATGETSTLTLNTTLANKDAFTLSGDWAFSANGEFTLA